MGQGTIQTISKLGQNFTMTVVSKKSGEKLDWSEIVAREWARGGTGMTKDSGLTDTFHECPSFTVSKT